MSGQYEVWNIRLNFLFQFWVFSSPFVVFFEVVRRSNGPSMVLKNSRLSFYLIYPKSLGMCISGEKLLKFIQRGICFEYKTIFFLNLEHETFAELFKHLLLY